MNTRDQLQRAYVATGLMTRDAAEAIPETGKPRFPDPMPQDVGIRPDIDHEWYHRIDARSNSELSRSGSPRAVLAFWAGYGNGTTDNMRLGTAVHELLLTPGRIEFNTDWPVNPKTGKGYGGDTAKVRDWMETVKHDGGYPIAPDALEEARVMVERFRTHPSVRALLDAGGLPEQTLLWNDSALGETVACKAKPDLYIPGFGLVDFKTTGDDDLSDRTWPWTMWKWRYHVQAAHYLRGAKACGLDAPAFFHAVIQKGPPFEVAVFKVDSTAIGHGEQDRQFGLNAVQNVLVNDAHDWALPEIVDIGLPAKVLERYADGEFGMGVG